MPRGPLHGIARMHREAATSRAKPLGLPASISETSSSPLRIGSNLWCGRVLTAGPTSSGVTRVCGEAAPSHFAPPNSDQQPNATVPPEGFEPSLCRV